MDFIEKYNCVGILGGTFNPIHIGHIELAKNAIKQYSDIEQIIIMPNNLPAYKENKDIADISHRRKMIEIAIKNAQDISISMMEVERGGITFTSDTLEDIKRKNPSMKIYFIIGADSLFSITKWHNYKDVLRLCTLLVARRSSDYNNMEEYALELVKNIGYGDIKFIYMDEINISSSGIRKDISEGRMPFLMLPEGLDLYIKKNKLYGCIDYES